MNSDDGRPNSDVEPLAVNSLDGREASKRGTFPLRAHHRSVNSDDGRSNSDDEPLAENWLDGRERRRSEQKIRSMAVRRRCAEFLRRRKFPSPNFQRVGNSVAEFPTRWKYLLEIQGLIIVV